MWYHSTVHGAVGFENLPLLFKVSITWNHFSGLPTLKGLPSLRRLEFQHNRLTYANLTGHFPSLEYLDLSSNHLTGMMLPQQCARLQHLDFSSNQLQGDFGMGSFSNFTERACFCPAVCAMCLRVIACIGWPALVEDLHFYLCETIASLVLPWRHGNTCTIFNGLTFQRTESMPISKLSLIICPEH